MLTQQERDSFYKIVASRRSVREFQEREIPPDVLQRILQTGRRAPSAANRQPWYFMAVTRAEGHPLYDLLYVKGFRNAPVLLVGLADRRRAWVRKSDGANYAWVDVAIALTEMILAATAEGLGTCWIAAFDSVEARRVLGLPPEVDPVSLVALGWPTEPLEPVEKDRKSLTEILRQGIWSP